MTPRVDSGARRSSTSSPLPEKPFFCRRNGAKTTRRLGAVMALRLQTEISGDVFILRCNGRIVFGDECAVLRERTVNMLPGTPRVVVNLNEVNYIDSGGLGILVGLFVSAKNRGGEIKLVLPRKRVKNVLRCTNLDRIFSLYENDNEAVAAFRKQVA